MNTLSGKVALVTGASRGIGASVARLFAQHGAKLVIHGRDRAALERVKGDIERIGGHAVLGVADLTHFDQIEAMRVQAERALGPIDVLVANAGGSFAMPAPLETISEQDWHASLNGNLTATFLTLKSILPGMKQRGSGAIVTISSAAGRAAHPQAPIPYSAAKAAIQVVTQDVAAQVGHLGSA